MYTTRTRLRRGIAGLLAVLLLTGVGLPMSAAAEDGNQTTGTATTPATSIPAVVAPSATPPAQQGTTPASDSQPAGNTPALAVSAQPASSSPSITATVAAPTSGSPAAATPANTQTAAPAASPSAAETPANTTASSNTTTVSNTVDASATTGKASVHDNQQAGNATSGSATSTATIVNVSNSSTGFGGDNGFTYYTHDINAGESVQGNILIDPSTLSPVDSSQQNNGLQTATSLTDIINNITLSAATGNASVHDNTNAGNATSGDAAAIANIINIANSQIGAKQTFLGVINIYGNLTGDIQVPSDFVNNLMANTGSTTDASLNASNNTTIDNTITTSATSGNASVHDNTNAGNATSGDATTNVTVFNLTGQQVIAKNSLLVFVNVLGKWVGVIVNQPAGATNGAFVGGQGAADDGIGGAVNTSNDTHITNNINVSAQSGNASVHDNQQAGNATSGSAKAGVNLLNISGSNFSLGDWFGVLFINVLGTWLGNFGIQTPIPDPVSSGGTTAAGGNPSDVIKAVKVFRFGADTSFKPAPKAKTAAATNGSGSDVTLAADTAKTIHQTSGKVLGASASRGEALVSKIDLVALVAIISALTVLLMVGSWSIRKRLVAARPE